MKQIISALIAVSLLHLTITAYRYTEYVTSNDRKIEQQQLMLQQELVRSLLK